MIQLRLRCALAAEVEAVTGPTPVVGPRNVAIAREPAAGTAGKVALPEKPL